MGCSESKADNQEAVSRCKNRRLYIHQAVSARHAFVASHVSYSASFKKIGAALSDFSHGEGLLNPNLIPLSSTSSVPPPPHLSPVSIPLPPQPPPPPPLYRAVTMPEFEAAVVEDEDTEEEEEGLRRRMRSVGGGIESTPSETEKFSRRSDEGGIESIPPETQLETGNDSEERERLRRRSGGVRSRTMPETSGQMWDFFSHMEVLGGSLDDVEEIRAVTNPNPSRSFAMEEKGNEEEVVEVVVEKPPLPPRKGGKGVKKGKAVSSGSGGGEAKNKNVNANMNVSMVKLFKELDDCFLKVYESAHGVLMLLEAARFHFHSNFADNIGNIDHSARVMRVITWNSSFRDHPYTEGKRDDFDSEENETHATVLDKLLAWEKKLYDEVKAAEVMKFGYQSQLALLNKQKKRGTHSESLEKTKAAVSHFRTRYVIHKQSLDSTISEINRLRDDQLYPKLVVLVDAMAAMWEAMQGQHENQLNISTSLKLVNISQASKETTDEHHEHTIQLWAVVQEWHTHFDKMVRYQKEYIKALNSWLHLNLIPIENNNLKDKEDPSILTLLITWHDLLEKLPDEHAKTTIFNFAAFLRALIQQQEDELLYKAKMEESRRDHERKQRHYNKWVKGYLHKKAFSHETESGSFDDVVQKDEVMMERASVVDNAKKKLEHDTKIWEQHCVHVKEKSLTSLKTLIPEVFQALSDFAMASSEMYNGLRAVCQSRSWKGKEPET